MITVLDAKQPLIVPITKGEYELVKDYEFAIKVDGDIIMFKIPRRFTYDGASVPRALWSVLGMSRDGLHRAAALIHDWLYVNRGQVKGDGFSYNREFADKMFYELLLYLGESRWRAWIAYKGVRLFGGRFWREQ